MPPLWAGYLSAVLKQAGHDVRVIDAAGLALDRGFRLEHRTYRGLTPAEILALIPEDVQLIGLSCMFSSSWPLVRHLLLFLRQHRPGALLVLGGEHATALPQLVFEQSGADVLVMGEGEETAVALWDALRAKEAAGQSLQQAGLQALAGLIWRDAAGNLHDTGRRERMRQLHDLPFPDWSDIPVENYISLNSGMGVNRGRYMPMLATRGCPYQCTFCASPNTWTTRWVARPPASVVEEMARNGRLFGATDFQLADLTPVLNKKWVLELADEIHKRNLKVTWQLVSGTRSECIDEDVARAMASSGCSNLAFALESGNADVLDRIKKRVNTHNQLQAARRIIRHGMTLEGFVIVGFPFETWGHLWRTWGLMMKAARVGFREVNVSTFSPVPGSEDFRNMVAAGQLTADDAYFDNLFNWLSLGQQSSFNPRISHRQLRAFVLFCYLSFFAVNWLLRPTRAWEEITSLLSRNRLKGSRLAKAWRNHQLLKHLPMVTVQAG